MLDIAKIEAGRLELDVAPFSLDMLIAEAIALTGPQARTRGVTLAVTGKTGLYVRADSRRVLQVLLNLLSNAVKYNVESGRATVETRREGRSVRITVTDTGIGVDASVADRLFQPFERLGEAARTVEGTGLGLALSKNLLEAMGGAIGWEPSPDGLAGAVFWFTLPYSAAVDSSATGIGRAQFDIHSQSEHTILLIEDNLAGVELIEAVVARHWPGTKLIAAMQARMGLSLALEREFDLVLLDLHLPDEPGGWVLDRLHAERPDLPVVLLTADAPATLADWTARGASAVLTKPVDLEALLATVCNLLGEKLK